MSASKPKRRKLQVLQATKDLESATFVEKIVTKTGAQMSAHAHGIYVRKELIALANRVLDAGVIHEGSTVLLKYRSPHSTKADAGIYWEEIRDAWETSTRHAKGEEAARAAYLSFRRTGLALQKASFLSTTSKMGCYSFNLLAGPRELFGTCPASQPGFMFSTPDAKARAKKALVVPQPINELNFVCNGCYALKGNYTTPNVLTGQVLRHVYALRLLAEGRLADMLVSSIESTSKELRAKRAKKPAGTRWMVQHPDYFRIHDAGDFFSPEYAEAWFEVCRRLPHVNFWAPTRMTALRKGSVTAFQRGIPLNLALRPSGLHFDQAAPQTIHPGTGAASLDGVIIPGLAAGSGALPEGTRAPGWACPATIHWLEGGGRPILKDARPTPKRPKPPPGEKLPKRKRAPGELTEGDRSYSCALAHGPRSPMFGGDSAEETPDGAGCRVCWKHRDLPVYYTEH